MSAWSPHYVKDRERLERVQHEDGAGVEGLGVRRETGEVEVDDSGGEKEPFRSGQFVQDFQKIFSHLMEFVLPSGQF